MVLAPAVGSKRKAAESSLSLGSAASGSALDESVPGKRASPVPRSPPAAAVAENSGGARGNGAEVMELVSAARAAAAVKAASEPSPSAGGRGGGAAAPEHSATSPGSGASSAPGSASVEDADAGVQVLTTPELVALQDADRTATALSARVRATLESGAAEGDDWLERYETTTWLRQLVHLHPAVAAQVVYGGDAFFLVLSFLARGVESLRSAQSRNALFAVGEVFNRLPAERRDLSGEAAAAAESASSAAATLGAPDAVQAGPVLAALVDSVVLKSANDKRFIASAGEAVLQSMVDSAPCLPLLLAILRHSSSKSSKVCSIASKYGSLCLRGLLARAPPPMPPPLEDTTLTALVAAFAELEESRSVDAKKPAQESLRALQVSTGAERFGAAVQSSLNTSSAQNVLAIVSKSSSKEAKPLSLKEMVAEKRREMARKT
jgi:hypothetical protein